METYLVVAAGGQRRNVSQATASMVAQVEGYV
jgi:hypothetical protein